MTLELNEKYSTPRVAFFEGGVPDLARKGKFRPKWAADNKECDQFGFDIDKTREFLLDMGILNPTENMITSYPMGEANHPAFEGLQFRMLLPYGGIIGDKISPNYHEPVLMDRLRSSRAGALVIDCLAVVRKDDVWYRVEPSEKIARSSPKFLRVEAYHALAHENLEESLQHPAQSKVISSVLSDIRRMALGYASPVRLQGREIVSLLSWGEPRVSLILEAGKVSDWAVEYFERTLQDVLRSPDGVTLLKVNAHLRTFGDQRYEAGKDAVYGTPCQPIKPGPAPLMQAMPLEKNEVMAALTRAHYQPALERVAKRAQTDGNLKRLLELM